MIEYRKAGIEDIDELVRLRLEFMKEAIDIKYHSNDLEMKEALSDYFKETIACNNFIAWLAEEGGRIVGTSGLCFYKRPPSYKNISGNIAYIMNMYTEPSYRNKGIASFMFEKIVSEAKNLGYKNLCLHATEKGRSLYLKFGFKETDNEMVLNF